MTSQITVSKQVPMVRVNILPVAIQYTGPSETKKYFTTSVSLNVEGQKKSLTSQFRGLKLVGEEVSSRGKVGYILSSSEFMVQDPQLGETTMVKQYSAIARFDTINVYGHDNTVPLTSKWKLMREWDTIAHIIHS